MSGLSLSFVILTLVGAQAYTVSWTSENLVPNPGFEGGATLRELNWATIAGTGAKSECVVECGAGRAETQAIRLGATEGDFELRSSQIVLPQGAERVSFSVYVKTVNSSHVYVALRWYRDKSAIKTSRGKPVSGDRDWTLLSMESKAPRQATSFQCVVCADRHSGVTFVDDACARAQIEGLPPLDILCNQVGYDPLSPVKVLVQSRLDTATEGVFRVLDAHGVTVREGELSGLGSIPVWERYYALADAGTLPSGDGYRVMVNMAGLSGTSYPFSVAPGILQRKTLGPAAGFYYYQRCGCEVPGWHAPCHMDDGRMPDGSHRDLTGGWHDAGDYNKYNGSGFTALSVYALAYAHERAGQVMDEYSESHGLPSALQEAAWGGDWLLKMQDQETGRLWGRVYAGRVNTALYWGPPENETDNVAGTADDRPVIGAPAEGNHGSQIAAMALARLGRLTGDGRYLEAAGRLYHAVDDSEVKDANAVATALIACLELEKARSSPEYAARAKEWAKRLLDCQIVSGTYAGGFAASPRGTVPVMSATNLGWPAAALSLYGAEHGDDLGIRHALRAYLRFSERLADNPFEISRLIQDGQPVFFQSVPKGVHHVAQNTMYLMQAWALACAARFLGDEAFRALAARHVDWVLGRNPFGLCMVEGQGSFNPPMYHHRYNSIPGHPRGAVPGAVCNGIARLQPAPDKPWFDMRTDISRPAFETTEPWLPHNATYLLALSTL